MTIAIVGLIAIIALQQYFYQQSQERWMRLFAVQQGVAIPLMEGKLETPKTELKKDTRPRMSIPIPTGAMPRPS